MGCDQVPSQRAVLRRGGDRARGPGPDPGGGPAHPLGRQPAGLGLRRLHRPRTARPAGQGVARRPSRRRVGGDDRAGGRRLRRRPAVRPDPVRPGSGDDERHGGRRRPGHRQRPWGACTTRRWRGGCWTFARIGSARCWSASGTPPTARWCRSSGPTGARSTRSCTAATGSGPYPLWSVPSGPETLRTRWRCGPRWCGPAAASRWRAGARRSGRGRVKLTQGNLTHCQQLDATRPGTCCSHGPHRTLTKSPGDERRRKADRPPDPVTKSHRGPDRSADPAGRELPLDGAVYGTAREIAVIGWSGSGSPTTRASR
jgi:hypothetical protein